MLRRLLAFTAGLPRFAALLSLTISILLPDLGFAQSRVAGGAHFTLVVTDSGNVWSFGSNSNGQLGLGHTTDSTSPTQVPGLTSVVAVAAGGFHSLALTSTGAVYAWGWNEEGQIGDDSTTQKSSPQLLDLSDVVAIAAGANHSLALTAAGDLYAWGNNNVGQLGTGTTSNSNVPVLVLTDVSAIGAGESHSLAAKADGTAWAWGGNSFGQLGNDDTTARTQPSQMIGISNAVAVYGGLRHSIIRLSNGTLKAAGFNTSQQLGDGTSVTQRKTPVAVVGLTNIEDVAVGSVHNLALDGDGMIWVWGHGSSGGLGTGSTAQVNPPVVLSSLTDISFISAGWAHSVAIDANGVVRTWGSNDEGELGDGTLEARLVPDAISSSNYSWRVATPTFSVAAGTYNIAKDVTVAVNTAGAAIHYTTDGSEPTELDTTVASGAVLTIDVSRTLKAKAWKTGMPDSAIKSATYTLQAAMPNISLPSGGPFNSPQIVAIEALTSGGTTRYTLDGTDPTSSSYAYSEPFAVSATTTIKSATFKSGWSPSSVRTATLTFDYGMLDTPSIDPATGNYAGTVSVTMSSTQSGVTIRYTTNGSTPTASSTAYSGPVSISQTTTVKAKAFHASYTTSAQTSRSYTMSAATPTLSVAGGSYAPGSVVTISTSEATATLRMTIDGNDPTSASPIVASGTSLPLGNFTLKVKAFRASVADSAVASATYSLTSALGPGAVTTGGAHNMLATPDGRVYAWGNNSNGQLGNESISDRPTPTLLNTITGVRAVASGLAHTLALTLDGQVYAWGSNGSGRLGNGSTDQSTRPVHVSTLSNVVAIAAGDAHSLALTSDGHVYSWGANTTGQLGLGNSGTGTDQIVPTQITTLSNISAIAAGDADSFAVTSGGQVYAWGANGNSRLGDGSTNQQNSPLLLSLSNVVSIAAGQAHTLALTSAGRIYGWGANGNGQLGMAAVATVATPTLIPNLHVSTVVAGDNHSAVIRADGALVMFGNSSSGQVGSGSITGTISTPTVISGLSNVSTVSLGDLHSVAVASTGDVWAWGESADYRLGNNSTTPDRSSPQSVLTGLASWAAPPPTINVASGALGGTTTVTLTSSTAGAVIRYTQNGALPTASDAAVPSNGQIEISYSSLLRARAFVAGRQAGVTPARADYELQSAPPVINPSTGTYTTAQTVSITATGAPGAIRYTVDGTEPSETSTLYSGSFVVSTAMTVKAKTFPSNGWSPSLSVTATLTLNYGTLDPPTVTPSGGAFAVAPQVTLSSIAGASIRYTLNGTTPTVSSTLYTSPISISAAGATLKSIAFHSDWSPSAVRTDLYVVDTTSPTIEPQFLPAQIDSWSRSPVTVNFFCFDNVQVASCSSPLTFNQEGAGQLVTAMATDTAGNQSQLPVTLNLDFSPPTVTLTSPIDESTTSNSTLHVTGQVADTLSGLASVKCNNVTATILDGALSCEVPLRPGRNVVVISTRDVAGNNASQGITVTLVGTVTDMFLTPSERTMLVGESATLSFRDAFGISPSLAVWQTSDDTIVSLSADDPPLLTALAEGQVTITASNAGIARTALLTVVAADQQTGELPTGTTRWKLATMMSDHTMPTAPIYTHPVDANGPDFFTVEPSLTDEYTVRAVSESGGVLWKEAAPGLPLMGDSYGAVIAGVEEGAFRCVLIWGEDRGCFTAFVRFGGSVNALPWRYDSAGYLDRPAQGPDGTIYAIEHLGGFGRVVDYDVFSDYGNNKSVVILDGATGQVLKRVPLATEYSRTPCGFYEHEPRTRGPIVNSDGDAYLLVHKDIKVATGTCNAPVTTLREVGWTLLRLTRNGVAETIIVDQSENLTLKQLLPDGVGGLLIRTPASLIRFDLERQRTEHSIPTSTRIDLVGQAGIIYLQTRTSTDDLYGITEALNVTTMTSLWTKSPGWKLTAAKPDGGATALDAANQLLDIDSNGQLVGTTAFGLARPVQLSATVIGQGTTIPELKAIAFDSPNATRFCATLIGLTFASSQPSCYGNLQSNLSLRDVEVSITVNVFIPEQWVDHPNVLAGTVFEGDNRSWSRAGSSRIHQEVRLSLNPNSFRNLPKIGTTREYHKASSLDSSQNITIAARNDTSLNDGLLKVGEATASMSSVTATRQQSGNVVTVHLVGSVGNPLVTSPTIDYEISFSVDFSDPANLQFTLIGDHDGFPNYEVYVNTEHIHGYAHGSETPFSLIHPMEKHFEQTGRVRQ